MAPARTSTLLHNRELTSIWAFAAAGVLAISGLRAWSSWAGVDEAGKYKAIFWAINSGFVNARVDVAIIAAGLCLATAMVWHRPSLAKYYVTIWAVFTCSFIFLSWTNALALTALGRPLTFQWLYYADMLRSFTSRSAVTALLSRQAAVALGIAFMTWLVAFFVLRSAIRRALNAAPRRSLTIFGAALVTYLGAAYSLAPRYALTPWVSTSPLAELLASGWAAWGSEGFENDELILPSRLAEPSRSADQLAAGLDKTQIRNVLVIVMESVGARFVAGFGEKDAKAWTPNLAAQLPQGIAFTNFFAHVPMSSKSLFSMLTGRYPVFSFETETTLLADQPVSMLQQTLHDSGLRTGLFMSGDLEFQNVDAFLKGRGFDQISDLRSISCALQMNKPGASFSNMDAVDDRCTADAVLEWIGKDATAPFFAMMWTGNTHFPYFGDASGSESSKPNSRERYIAAVRSSDAAIGHVFESLARTGRLSDTLVVVVGDHGESFGDHGEAFHGGNIFDEQVHVPLLLIHPSIIGPVSDDRVGGMIDLAPTILDIVAPSKSLPADGRSLFDTEREAHVFLFAPNQSMVAGYRTKDKKHTFDLRSRTAAIYDLASDPGELRNVAQPGDAARIRQTLAGWLQTQRKKEFR